MSGRDPRAALVILGAAILAALFGGPLGLAAAAVTAAGLLATTGHGGRSVARALAAIIPLALAVAALDALAGDPARGALGASRLVVLVFLGASFAAGADGERIADGLQALRVPFAVSFVLVTGARFVPIALADVGELRDAALLRGLPLDGPPWRQARGWRALLVPLLVTTVRHGLQLGEAMELRGFGVARRTSIRSALRWTWADTAVCLLALAGLIAVLGAGWPPFASLGVTAVLA